MKKPSGSYDTGKIAGNAQGLFWAIETLVCPFSLKIYVLYCVFFMRCFPVAIKGLDRFFTKCP